MGMPNITNMVIKTLNGSRLTFCKIGSVLELRLHHIFRFKGVINIAAMDDTAVILIDTAVLPLAR